MPIADDFRARLREVLACPTAPFHEQRVHAVLRAAVRASPRLRDRLDPYGNLEVVYGKGRPRLYFACHTDHPALVARGDGTADIVGGMRPASLKGIRLRTFDGDGPRPVIGGLVRGDRQKKRVRLTGAGARTIKRDTPLVVDLPPAKITATRLRAPAIDDLCAVAACLTLLDRLEAAQWPGTVGILFTRAEEVGFAGALGWCHATAAPNRTTIINLEMSPERKHAPQGGGPILRVGDRVTTFIQGVGIDLAVSAEDLAKRDPSFRWQRALMDGGACEATVYTFSGFRSGALCLALRNYHNHGPKSMAHEYVHADDAENLVKWMVAYTRDFGHHDAQARTQKRLDRLWRRHQKQLARTAVRGEG